MQHEPPRAFAPSLESQKLQRHQEIFTEPMRDALGDKCTESEGGVRSCINANGAEMNSGLRSKVEVMSH